MQDFIEDGYTLSVRLNAQLGQHNQCDFTFRPLAGNEGARTNDRISQVPEVARGHHKREFVKSRLEKWSLKTADGQPAPIDDERLMHVPSSLFSKLYLVMLGFLSPDAELDAQGQPVPFSDLAGDIKN